MIVGDVHLVIAGTHVYTRLADPSTSTAALEATTTRGTVQKVAEVLIASSQRFVVLE